MSPRRFWMTARTLPRCCWRWKVWGTYQKHWRERVLFAATAAEEVGGHGALWLLRQRPAAVGIALEIGPRVPESPFPLDDQPTVWVNDSLQRDAGGGH